MRSTILPVQRNGLICIKIGIPSSLTRAWFGHVSLLPVIRALNRRLFSKPGIESQQEFLPVVPNSLALEAAACAIEGEKLKTAVKLLEQGRAVVWARLRGYRHSFFTQLSVT